MNFEFIIKKCITDVCDEVNKEENMNILKNDILNPIVEHVKFVLGSIFIFILLLVLIFLNLRIIYK